MKAWPLVFECHFRWAVASPFHPLALPAGEVQACQLRGHRSVVVATDAVISPAQPSPPHCLLQHCLPPSPAPATHAPALIPCSHLACKVAIQPVSHGCQDEHRGRADAGILVGCEPEHTEQWHEDDAQEGADVGGSKHRLGFEFAVAFPLQLLERLVAVGLCPAVDGSIERLLQGGAGSASSSGGWVDGRFLGGSRLTAARPRAGPAGRLPASGPTCVDTLNRGTRLMTSSRPLRLRVVTMPLLVRREGQSVGVRGPERTLPVVHQAD